MYLYPFKIFALSRNKRLINYDNPNEPVGIYNVEKMNYDEATSKKEAIDNCNVSILLGEIAMGVKLICLDLDDCFLDNGELEPLTKEFLKEFSSNEYEVSTSGTGLHIYILTKMDLETFIVKELEGCKSFECYTNKRHIVTTYFDFAQTNLVIGAHDEFIKALYNRVSKQRQSSLKEDVKLVFQGKEITSMKDIYSAKLGRTPVTDMYTLRGIGYKDPTLITIIDENPDSVDQSAHDAKLVRKLMYYTLDFDDAWDMAKKTNYYKAKDKRHKIKFDNPTYKERTRRFIAEGG